MLAPVLDWFRGNFIYVVAFLLPMAGAVLVVWQLTEGDRDKAGRILAAAVLGACVYALVIAS